MQSGFSSNTLVIHGPFKVDFKVLTKGEEREKYHTQKWILTGSIIGELIYESTYDLITSCRGISLVQSKHGQFAWSIAW